MMTAHWFEGTCSIQYTRKIASFNYFESGNRESDDENDDEPLELWVSYVKPNPAESNGVLIPPAS